MRLLPLAQALGFEAVEASKSHRCSFMRKTSRGRSASSKTAFSICSRVKTLRGPPLLTVCPVNSRMTAIVLQKYKCCSTIYIFVAVEPAAGKALP